MGLAVAELAAVLGGMFAVVAGVRAFLVVSRG